jgi:hypothetical protein
MFTSFTQCCGEDDTKQRDPNLHVDSKKLLIRSPGGHMHISSNFARYMEQNFMYTQSSPLRHVFSTYDVVGEWASRVHM